MSAQQHSEERIENFAARCREAGLKVTHQRQAIYAMMARTETHPTPEDVYARIRRELPSISLATVYKILDLFHRHGFLRKVSTENQVARYDANVAPHHHLVCSACGRIRDVTLDEQRVNGLVPQQTSEDFSVTHADVIFHGLCGECRAS